jgi:hypothetical protein
VIQSPSHNYVSNIGFYQLLGGLCPEDLSNSELGHKIRYAAQYVISSDRSLGEIEGQTYIYNICFPTTFLDYIYIGLDYNALARKLNQSDDINRIASFFGISQGAFLERLIDHVNVDNLSLKAVNRIRSLSGICAALCSSGSDAAKIVKEIVRNLGTSHIVALFQSDSDKDIGRCYGMIASADDLLKNELLEIIKAMMCPYSLEEIKEFIYGVMDQASLFGRQHVLRATEPLLNTIECVLRKRIDEEENPNVVDSFAEFFWAGFPLWIGTLPESIVQIGKRLGLSRKGASRAHTDLPG